MVDNDLVFILGGIIKYYSGSSFESSPVMNRRFFSVRPVRIALVPSLSGLSVILIGIILLLVSVSKISLFKSRYANRFDPSLSDASVSKFNLADIISAPWSSSGPSLAVNENGVSQVPTF
jgi:hypothetical protein